ncbi:MAG: hypothetical protein JWM95_695 [Gemmatimonadetes bacterium]|nr:hypothetical protein [Gemmatimonadota bacterium]
MSTPFEQTPMTGDGMRALGVAIPLLERTIRRVAHSMTPDADHRDDLIQAAWVELWEGDVTRYILANPGDFGFVREILINKMTKVWGGRREDSGEAVEPTAEWLPKVDKRVA